MKTKIFSGVIAYPFMDKFVLKISRIVKYSQPPKIEERFYSYDYKSDHIFTALKRFSNMIELHHKNLIRDRRKTNGLDTKYFNNSYEHGTWKKK